MKLKKLLIFLLAAVTLLSSALFVGCNDGDHQAHEHKISGSEKYLLFDIEANTGYKAYACKKCGKTAIVKGSVALTNEIPTQNSGSFSLTVNDSAVYSFSANDKGGLIEKAIVVSTHNELQTKFLQTDGKYMLDEVSGQAEHSKPLPVTLSWTYSSDASYAVTVFDGNTVVFSAETSDLSVEVFNLLAGKKYAWQVVATKDGIDESSQKVEFYVSSSCPRNVAITAVTNCRDMGGWITENNSRVKQGMIYRTAKLDNLANEKYSKGKDDLSALGIKTEIDLRGKGHNDGDFVKDVLGEKVNYLNFSMGTNKIISDEENLQSIKSVFETFADENAYPMLFHCSIGTDRTGALAFLLNGLLGVSEEQLYCDYVFSGLGSIGGTRNYRTVENYVETVREHGKKDDSLSLCIYNYLSDVVGVSEENLDKIIDLMTE